MMRKYKTIFVLLVVATLTVLSLLLLNSNLKPKDINISLENEGINRNPSVQSIKKKNLSFEYYVENSTDCVIGKYQGFTECENDFINYEFKVTDEIYRSHTDDVIKVRIARNGNSTDGGINPNTFKLNHEYMLVLYGEHNLFLDYTAYSIMGYMVIDIADLENAYWSSGRISISDKATRADLNNHVKTIESITGFNKAYDKKIFRTEDVETVIKNCDAVFKIEKNFKISDLSHWNASSYECKLIEKYKGGLNLSYGDRLIIRTYMNELDNNNDYIIALSLDDLGEGYYDQASPICIFDADDAEMEAQIKEWLSEKNVP